MTQVLELEKALRKIEALGPNALAAGQSRRTPLVLTPLDGDDIAEQLLLDRVAAIRLAIRALTEDAAPEPATDAARRSVQRLPATDPFATFLKDVAAHRSARA